MPRTAKLFRSGRSQAVRLPPGIRFEGTEVYIRRDPTSRDVILSPKAGSWQEFFELTKDLEVPDDFLGDRSAARRLVGS